MNQRAKLLIFAVLAALTLPLAGFAQSHSQMFDYTAYNAYWNGANWLSYASGYSNVLTTNASTGDFTVYTGGTAASAGLTRTLTPAMTVTAAGTVSAVAFVGSGSGLTNVTATPGGTTTQMQYNNGGTLAGSGVYYVSSTGRMGVGTSAPISLLQVGGLGTSSWQGVGLGNAYYDGASYYGTGYIGFNLAGGGNSYITGSDTGSNGASAIFGDIFGNLYFANFLSTGASQHALTGSNLYGNTKLFISYNGNVGISTTSPGRTLDVNGGIRTRGWGSSAAGTLLFGAGEKSSIYGDDSSVMAFYTNTTERMRIDNSGFVGIGTTSPDAKLEVSGSVMVDAFNYTGGQKVGYYFRNGFGSSSGNAYNLSIIADQFAVPGRDGGLSVNAYDGIRFVTGTNDATGERMRINASGNIGIGTTSPNAPLDVNGTISATNVKAAGTVTYGAYSSAPVACAAGYKGMVAMSNTLNDLCLCTGMAWVRVGSGGTACSW